MALSYDTLIEVDDESPKTEVVGLKVGEGTSHVSGNSDSVSENPPITTSGFQYQPGLGPNTRGVPPTVPPNGSEGNTADSPNGASASGDGPFADFVYRSLHIEDEVAAWKKYNAKSKRGKR